MYKNEPKTTHFNLQTIITASAAASTAMFLNENQLENVLSNSLFTEPYTESVVHYEFYRGQLNTTVHTLRFNFNANLNEEFILQILVRYLFTHFDPSTPLVASINYDLLLQEFNGSRSNSYYVWRANSNAVHYSSDNEVVLSLTHNNIFRFVQNCTQVHLPSLDIYFQSSSVVINRPLAIVFSFFNL